MVSGTVCMTVGSSRQLSARKNENKYGFLQADNMMNVVSSADLVFHSLLKMMKRDTALVMYCLVEQCKSGVCTSGGQ